MRGRPPKAPKVTRTCKQCGKKWKAYPWEDNNRKDYCSRECFAKSQVGKRRELVEREERACASCGKVFLVGGTGNRTKIAKYCSRSCAKHGNWGDAQHTDARKMTKIERAWFAGVFDGEGCVAWPRRPLLHSIRLNITSTNEAFITKIEQVSGTGRVAFRKPAKPQHSPTWTWACYGKNSLSILRQVLPWLIVKREAAEAALGLNGATEPPWTQRSKSMRGSLNADAGAEEGRL